MNILRIKKGIIAVALTYIVIITLTLAVLIGTYRYRVPLSANAVKRAQAFNYTETALYEAFNRFRNGQWDVNSWPPASGSTITINGVPIIIDVADEVFGTITRKRVSARISYEDVKL